MSPACGYMDKYPDRSSQIPGMPQYQSWPGSVPPELRFDPSGYPAMQGWLCIGGYHNHLAPCHPCPNYMPFPSHYYYPPPCPSMFQPQPLHYWGAYPGNPEVLPAQQVPPPGYWRERPKYEFDKKAAQDHHCCGCPNHVCRPNEEKGIKIEEQEPNLETKEKDSLGGENNSLVPIYIRNHPYPIVWVAPESMKHFEGGKLPKQVMDSKDGSHEMEHGVKPVRKEATQNSWCPLKMDKNFSPPEPAAGQKGSESPQDGDNNRRQFPFPIIWMPSFDKQEEEEVKDKKDNPLRSSENLPSTLKILSVHPGGSRDDESREVGKNKKNSTRAESDKAGEPIKQNAVQDVKSSTNKDSEDRQGTDYSDKDVIDSTPGSKEKPSSPTKASRLSPVCLRVDPLPKKKSGSRSPSPPDTKRGSSMDTSPKVKEVKVHDLPPHNENASKDTMKTEELVKRVERMGETRSNINEVESRKESNLKQFEAAKEEKTRSQDDGSATLEHAKTEVVGAQGDKMERCSAKKNLSDGEAACLIQSTYRGYEVRKWDSLKKLKQMARVRDEVVKIRKSIDVLKSGSEDLTDQKRLVISESIMRLLLQLDSIQGLHPSLREIRKSLARELVYLQSELDSLASKKSENSVKELSAASSKELGSHSVLNQDEQARETEDLVQALPDENCESRPVELEETQHHQCDSVCDGAPKVDEAIQDRSLAPPNSVSGEGDENKEFHASVTCLKENPGNEHAEKLHTEEEGVTSNEIEVVPINQIDSDLTMPLLEGKDDVNAGGAANEIVNSCVQDKEDVNDASSDLAPRSDYLNPAVTGGESNTDAMAELPSEVAPEGIHEPSESMKHEAADAESSIISSHVDNVDSTSGESSMHLLAELPTEIAAEEIHESLESMKHRGEANAGADSVPESCDSSQETIKQHLMVEQDMAEASKKTMLDGNLHVDLQPQRTEVPEMSSEGCKDVDALRVPEDDSAEQLANRETASGDSVGFDGPNGLKDAYPEEKVEQQAPVLEMEDSYSASEVPVKEDSNEDSEGRCEARQLVDAEATREPEAPEEKVVVVASDQSVSGKAGESTNEVLVKDSKEDPEERCQEGEPADVEATQEPEVPEEEAVLVAPGQSIPGKASDLSNVDSFEQHDAADANEKLKNEKLREMMEKLLEAGKDQLNVISDLTGRVQDLEKRLARTKKMRARRCKAASMRSRHGKLSPDSGKKIGGDVVM